MLSVQKIGMGNAGYYLSEEQSFLHGTGDAARYWSGDGSKFIGLTARSWRDDDFRALYDGFDPGGQKLVANAGNENRQCGWDLTFSAPKSVSILWSQADPAIRTKIRNAHRAAVSSAVEHFEAKFLYSRVGKGGADLIKATGIVANFEHFVSRELDPQIHTHSFLVNAAIGRDQESRTVFSPMVYATKMYLGAYYRTQLAYELRQGLGWSVYRPTNSSFEVSGIQRNQIEHFSKRRQQIEARLAQWNSEGARASAFAAKATRKRKEPVAANALFAKWQSEGQQLGIRPPQQYQPKMVREGSAIGDGLEQAIRKIELDSNFFTKLRLATATLNECVTSGVRSSKVALAVDSALKQNGMSLWLGKIGFRKYWTTPQVLADEDRFIDAVNVLQKRSFSGCISPKLFSVKKVVAGQKWKHLSAEQLEAVKYVTSSGCRIKVLTGLAGTGKTSVLRQCVEIFEAAGYKAYGTALANTAARELERKAKVNSRSIRSTLFRLTPSATHQVKHHVKQLVRAAGGEATSRYKPLRFDSNTVLIIDEASMVGTPDFADLLSAVAKQGGIAVVVGDTNQIQSIERGGGLQYLSGAVDGVQLTDVKRQKDKRDVAALNQLIHGDAAGFLNHFADKGQLHVADSKLQSCTNLINLWKKNGGVDKPENHRIFAGTHKEVNAFNREAQKARAAAGAVDVKRKFTIDEQVFCVGDFVRFNNDNAEYGLEKATTGVIEKIKKTPLRTLVTVSVAIEPEPEKNIGGWLSSKIQSANPFVSKTSGKKLLTFPVWTLNPIAKPYEGLKLNYCQTTHSAQAQDAKNVYIRMSSQMASRELTYVQASRHTDDLHLFSNVAATGKELAIRAANGQNREPTAFTLAASTDSPITEAISRSNAKFFARDFQNFKQAQEATMSDARDEYIKTLEEKVESLHDELELVKNKRQQAKTNTQSVDGAGADAPMIDLQGSKTLKQRQKDDLEAMAAYIDDCDFDFGKKQEQEQEQAEKQRLQKDHEQEL